MLGLRAHILVRRSDLLEALIGVFESFWQIAVPLPADESIARELGVSERTVGRRITRLQEAPGAQTRLQPGVQAGRRGWL